MRTDELGSSGKEGVVEPGWSMVTAFIFSHLSILMLLVQRDSGSGSDSYLKNA